jgi:hypothetical protein
MNETHTVISFLDNGSDDYRNTSSTSAGMIVSLDHQTNTSIVLKRFEAPGMGLYSSSQGNAQVLPNGNVFIGWGSNASVSEHTGDGSVAYFASFQDKNAMNYRAFKGNWKATPSAPPKLVAQASSSNSPVTLWASWNGATEYNSWSNTESGPMQFLGSAPKQGFQTTFKTPKFYPHAIAEAVSVKGIRVRNATVATVKLP